jgi:hypothetical protein
MRVTSMAYSLGFKEDEEDMKRYMKKRTLGKLPKEIIAREVSSNFLLHARNADLRLKSAILV